MFVGAFGLGSETGARAGLLPYDETNPVIYDNDSPEDMYTDELVLALNTLGRIDLRGMVTTNGGWSERVFDAHLIAAHSQAARSELVAKAARSGMKNVPFVLLGSADEFERPPSGRVTDTMPQGTAAAQFIVEQARAASPGRPIVIVTGGPVSTVADALLLDPSIASRIVVAWNAQPTADEFNATAPPFLWASDIVLHSVQVVLFPGSALPVVQKPDLVRLPDTELRRFMIDKALPHVDLPGDMDGDAAPAIPLIRSDYVQAVVRQRWAGRREGEKATLVDDPNGNIWNVTRLDRQTATDAWWQTMTDTRAWGGHPSPATPAPFGGQAAAVPGRIEAEAYDDGGPGVGYSVRDHVYFFDVTDRRVPIFRVIEHVQLDDARDTGEGYNVARLAPGDWASYSIDVSSPRRYALTARVAAQRNDSRLAISVDGQTIAVASVPSTGGLRQWQTLRLGDADVPAGRHAVRLTLEAGNVNLNWFEAR